MIACSVFVLVVCFVYEHVSLCVCLNQIFIIFHVINFSVMVTCMCVRGSLLCVIHVLMCVYRCVCVWCMYVLFHTRVLVTHAHKHTPSYNCMLHSFKKLANTNIHTGVHEHEHILVHNTPIVQTYNDINSNKPMQTKCIHTLHEHTVNYTPIHEQLQQRSTFTSTLLCTHDKRTHITHTDTYLLHTSHHIYLAQTSCLHSLPGIHLT